MDKIRILQCPVGSQKGGRTQYILNCWKYINKNLFHFDFITFLNELDFEEEIRKDGCQVYHISAYPEDDMDKFIKEFDEILMNKYDVVHIHTGYWKSFIMEERAHQMGVKKVIVHAHGTGVGNKKSGSTTSAAERRMLERQHDILRRQIPVNWINVFAACSREAADWLYGKSVPADIVHILKNAIDVEQYKYRANIREKARRKFQVEGKFVIGHVGRFEFQKNHEFIISVFQRISVKIGNIVLVLVGSGTEREKIEKMVKELGLKEKVIFAGNRNDMNEIYQMFDVFVLPSHWEAFPISLVEAQCAGIHCLCSTAVPYEASFGGLTQYLELNLEEWETALEEVVKVRENTLKLRADAAAIVRAAGYDLITAIHELENLYQS